MGIDRLTDNDGIADVDGGMSEWCGWGMEDMANFLKWMR